MEISELNLEPIAEEGARKLRASFPHIRFTSGRRSIVDQARAMAQNAVRNRSWIRQTYTNSEAATALQQYVDQHPDKRTSRELQDGFVQILQGFNSEQLTRLSKHLGGRAFDIQPIIQDAAAIKQMARSLNGVSKFLDKEGGLVRWHVQF